MELRIPVSEIQGEMADIKSFSGGIAWVGNHNSSLDDLSIPSVVQNTLPL